jgi:hypothetical protein
LFESQDEVDRFNRFKKNNEKSLDPIVEKPTEAN